MDPVTKLQRSRWFLAGGLLLALLVLYGCPRRDRDADRSDSSSQGKGCARRRDRTEGHQPLPKRIKRPPPLPTGFAVAFPTAQTNLMATDDATVYMPTASGRVESALYGSTRTRLDANGRAIAAFHAGLDIAPLERDRSGRALDAVFSVADGTVVYANRLAGNSNYGRYIMIEHQDEAGPVYSLYAHLSAVHANAVAGRRVARGDPIGTMGNSSTMGIPVVRAHLHLEIGVLMNRQFEGWCVREGLDTRHGIYHGWNMNTVDPLALYRTPDGRFSLRDHLASLPAAFELTVRTPVRPDYFNAYAALWQTSDGVDDAIRLAVCEGGVVISGRAATPDERARLQGGRTRVENVDPEVLGRNGRGLITLRGGTWILTGGGERWLSILMYR